jgi:hypothetical protein
MAPKLSRSMDDPRIPGTGGGAPVPQPPTGAASAPPPGLLNANGPLTTADRTLSHQAVMGDVVRPAPGTALAAARSRVNAKLNR